MARFDTDVRATRASSLVQRYSSAACVICLPLFSSGCVKAPGVGGQVEATSSAVAFTGVDLAPSQLIVVESSPAAAGPFVAVPGATATTSIDPTHTIVIRPVKPRITVPLYGFSLSTVIPADRWHTVSVGSCPAAETFVRVRNGRASFVTFDTDTVGMACIQSAVSGGSSAQEAVLDCSASQTPVLRLVTAPIGSEHVGDVVIDDPSDLAALTCVSKIAGSLTITATAPNTVSLPLLQHVTGNVDVTLTSYLPSPPPAMIPYQATRCGALKWVTADVRVFDAPMLATVDGDVTLNQQGTFPGGASTQPIDVGLNALTSVGGSLAIEVDQFGGSPCGLTSLAHVPGDLTIHFDNFGEVDSNINGLLAALTSVAGTFTVEGGHNTFANPFGALTQVGGLHVIKSPATTGFHFTALTHVDGTVELEGTGPGSAPTGLTNVGTLIVRNSSYATLETIGAAAIAVGNLEVRDNPSLTMLTVAGASKMTLAPSGSLTFDDNASLPSGEVCNFVAIQTGKGWSGPHDLDGAVCP